MADKRVKLSPKQMKLGHDEGDPLARGASFSGGERDCVFLSHEGRSFQDISGISGLDHPGDGRVSAFLDFDRDGWLDLVVANNNAPEFQLFRNDIGATPGAGARGRTIALRFVGGNRKAEKAGKLSPRDGYGARAWVELPDGRRLLREHRCGEGFAGQNSATLLVGIGAHERASKVTVEWPGGRRHEVADVAAGTVLTCYEVPEQGPGGKAFVAEPYARPRSPAGAGSGAPPPFAPSGAASERSEQAAKSKGERLVLPGAETAARLRMYTTMSTDCSSCKKQQPQLARLRQRYPEAALAMYGVPVEKSDTPARLEAYRAAQKPAYTLLVGLPEEDVERVEAAVKAKCGLADVTPLTVVTDGEGNVLFAREKVPTVSEIERLLSGR